MGDRLRGWGLIGMRFSFFKGNVFSFLLAACGLLAVCDSAFALHYARTIKAVSLNGAALPVGSYVNIIYDGGEVWYTSRYALPKSAVTLIPNTNFSPPLPGTMIRSTPVFQFVPNIENNPATLRQAERVPPVSNGAAINIMSRQGDDYIAVIKAPVNRDGMFFGRLPVADVASQSSQPGTTDPVPPAPPGFTQRSLYTVEVGGP
jgi:hypothetical protein